MTRQMPAKFAAKRIFRRRAWNWRHSRSLNKSELHGRLLLLINREITNPFFLDTTGVMSFAAREAPPEFHIDEKSTPPGCMSRNILNLLAIANASWRILFRKMMQRICSDKSATSSASSWVRRSVPSPNAQYRRDTEMPKIPPPGTADYVRDVKDNARD